MARARAQADTDADDVERWVRAYYAHVPPEDLAARTVEELAGAALAHWSLMQQRLPGELKVRVYNPTLEEHGWESPHTVVEFVNDDMPFLVDSISMEINRHGSGLHLIIHPIVARAARRAGPPRGARRATAASPSRLIHVEVDRQTDPQALAELARRPRTRARRCRRCGRPTGRRCSTRHGRSSRISSGARRPSTGRSSPRRSTCSSGCARTSRSSATATTRSPRRTPRRCSARCRTRGSASCARRAGRRSRRASRGCRPTCDAWRGTSTCSS